MNWVLSCVIFLLSHATAIGQGDHFLSIDNSALHFPQSVTASSDDVAKYIRENFNQNKSRIRAAYRWITANIRYDKDSMLSINWNKEYDEKIAATMRRKKGVCDNFASVFADILSKMNIPAFVINGNCRSGGAVSLQGHSWTAVQVENKWLLCDPTWDISYNGSPRFFLMQPEEFIYTHLPFDPLWQLLPRPVTYSEFAKGYTTSHSKASINVADSIKVFMAMDNLQQMQATGRRMIEAGLQRPGHQNWYGYNNMNIAIVHGEKAMHIYNGAVADLNQAGNLYNSFARFRNNMFMPTRNDEEIKEMIAPAKKTMLAAREKILALVSMKENFQYNTGELEERLTALEKKVDEQLLFLKKYFAATPMERNRLFYQ